jgi:hypothetical protein
MKLIDTIQLKKGNIEAVINIVKTKFGITYHVFINKKEGTVYKVFAPSKDFKTYPQAVKYAKSYLLKRKIKK